VSHIRLKDPRLVSSMLGSAIKMVRQRISVEERAPVCLISQAGNATRRSSCMLSIGGVLLERLKDSV